MEKNKNELQDKEKNPNTTTNKENNQKIIEKKIKINFVHEVSIKIEDKNLTVLDIRKQISKKLLLKANEYELFISNYKLEDVHNKMLIFNLFNQFKTNIFIIRSFKNIFDIQKQLKEYDTFLSNKLIEKEEEIKNFNAEYQKLVDDLNNL